MAGDTERMTDSALAEEVKQAAQSPGLSEEIRSLLERCYRGLAAKPGAASPSTSMNEEYESIARMIEAEAVIWPEDEERLTSLAARVRDRKSGGEKLRP